MREYTALELGRLIRAGEIGAREAAAFFIGAALKNEHNAFLCVNEKGALARAERVQKQIRAGEAASPLAGVPIALKDNIVTTDMPTTCASKTLQGYTSVYTASAAQKLLDAGLVIIGKCNMDEFAMGGSSETGFAGPVLNPRDKTRVAGGSSGGCAAAVAAGEAPLALGSDTGGSIRQPCSFCGVTGIKPTYGAVSRSGLIAYASSLDQIGPIAKNTDDCAALLEIISGPDERDATCAVKEPFSFGAAPPANAGEAAIGVARNFLTGAEEAVINAVSGAARTFEQAGFRVEEFDMPFTDFVIPAYYIIACAEASSNLSRYDGLKYGYRSEAAQTLREVYRLSRSEGFGAEVKRRVTLGSFVLSSGYYDAYYKKARAFRAALKAAYNKLFERFSFILSPVAPTTAYKIGENSQEPLKMYLGDIYTVGVNLAGLPAVALPRGRGPDGMPAGFQLIGRAFSEPALVGAARVYEKWAAKGEGE